MNEDAETTRQIAELAHDPRPLLALDVDEVVLEFVTPFTAFVHSRGFAFKGDAFRLTGNVIHADTGQVADPVQTMGLLDGFFEEQADWQICAPGAQDVLARMAVDAEIVLLTAMPHRFRAQRRKLLDALGLPYPLLTTEASKGPSIRRLRGQSGRRAAFVDDLPHNLVSVQTASPDVSLFHLMAHKAMRAMLPPLPDGIHELADWNEAETAIAAALHL